MGIDIRVGKKDYFVRYRVYKNRVDIVTALVPDDNFIGILHAKDITSYDTTPQIVGGVHQNVQVRATIETTDVLLLEPNYWLYCLPEKMWYRIESVAPNSHNESQQYSARPINTTQIVVVRGG